MSNVGMMQFNQGKDSLALATLNTAHEIAPASITILGNRARILMATGREKEAFDDFGRIIELDSTAVIPRFNHGIIALKARDIATATQDFEYLNINRDGISAFRTRQLGRGHPLFQPRYRKRPGITPLFGKGIVPPDARPIIRGFR